MFLKIAIFIPYKQQYSKMVLTRSSHISQYQHASQNCQKQLDNMLFGNKLQTSVTFTLDVIRGHLQKRSNKWNILFWKSGKHSTWQLHVRKSRAGEKFSQTLFLWEFLSSFKGLPKLSPAYRYCRIVYSTICVVHCMYHFAFCGWREQCVVYILLLSMFCFM